MPKDSRNKPKKLGRKKLSLYNRTVKYYWRVVNTRPILARKKDREQKVSYKENLARLKHVYRKVKELQSQSDTPIFKGNVQKDYSLILNIYRIKPWNEEEEGVKKEPDYLIPLPNGQYSDERQIGSSYYDLPFFIRDELNHRADDMIFEFECDDSGRPDGRNFSYTTIPNKEGKEVPITGKDLVEVLASSELYWYCKKLEKENEQFYPYFYIKERRGNEYVKYGMTLFIEGNGTVVGEAAKPKEKPPIEEPKEEKPLVESEEVRLQELKTKEAEELNKARQAEKEIEVEKTKQKHSDERKEIRDMFKQGLISKDEMMQLLEMI